MLSNSSLTFRQFSKKALKCNKNLQYTLAYKHTQYTHTLIYYTTHVPLLGSDTRKYIHRLTVRCLNSKLFCMNVLQLECRSNNQFGDLCKNKHLVGGLLSLYVSSSIVETYS